MGAGVGSITVFKGGLINPAFQRYEIGLIHQLM